ncbi:hypothetical protein CsatB_011524 [Cannabis sativa]
MNALKEDFLEIQIGTSADSLAKSLDSQRELFHSQVDQLQRIVVTQCKLTGANPLSQEMAAGALSIQIVIVDALLQRFLPLARRRIETAQAQVLARKAKNQYTWKGFEAIPKALKELKDEGLKENFSSFDGNDDSKVSDDEEDDERISDTRTESQPDKLNPSLNLKPSASSKPVESKIDRLINFTQGTRVDAVIFAEDIEALEDTLHELHTYHISDARVNRTPARYLKNGTNYHFNWTLNSKTQVVEVQEEDKQISKPVHEFVSFKNLSSDKYSNTPQDIIGVAVKINPTKVVNTVYGQRTIQEIYLIDDSCSFHPICLTLWGALVQDISEKLSEVTGNNPIIMGTKMIVQTKRGLSLSSRESSTIEINPDNYEATTLHQWYDS